WEKPGILKSQEYTGPIHDLPLDYCLEIKTEEALLISGSAEMMQRIRELAEKKAQKEAQNKGKND
ncbi:MAG: hypothetical protein LBI26_03515, partial [Holosporales bacterium]|nr:hypothetical protein [Holosporales bacterium]